MNRVNYEIMSTQAKKIRESGVQINNEISKVYLDVEGMHEIWYGKRYNELLKAFNNIIPQLNTMLDLVVGKLPYALELIANNYSLVDRRQNETIANNEEPNRIKELAIPNDTKMRFISQDVINTHQEITGCLERAREQMNNIENEYNKILWESKSSKVFEPIFKQLKDKTIMMLENINAEFKKLIEQAENDIEMAEKANMEE